MAVKKPSPGCRAGIMLLCVLRFPLKVCSTSIKSYTSGLAVLSEIMEKLITTTGFRQYNSVKVNSVLSAQGNDGDTKGRHCLTAHLERQAS